MQLCELHPIFWVVLKRGRDDDCDHGLNVHESVRRCCDPRNENARANVRANGRVSGRVSDCGRDRVNDHDRIHHAP